MSNQSVVSTFSIVARDPETGDLGVAVQSKFFCVGAVVPFARAGIGAIATQAMANTTYGPRGLALLQAGWTAQAVADYLILTDPHQDTRQFGIVDRFGNAVSHTGQNCHPWAGGRTGASYCVQGNILVSQDTTDAMADAYERATGAFASRLIEALEAGQLAGGDRRGQQSASLLVVRHGAGYGAGDDRLLQLQIEDHQTPIAELRRLYNLHGVFFRTDDAELVTLDGALLARIQEQLVQLGYLPKRDDVGREDVMSALETFAGTENLEERMRTDDRIDTVILDFLDDLSSRTSR